MKYSVLIIFSALLIACSGPKYPAGVEDVLLMSGDNRVELEKVFEHYHQQSDSLKLKAAYFLIGNMGDKHSYITFVLVDSTENVIPFDVLEYDNYNALLDAWDLIEEENGKVNFKRDQFIKDQETVTSDYLIKNIDLAFEAWEKPWASHLNFKQFCEFILPYRSSNEPVEEWRSYFLDEYSWLIDSMKNRPEPVMACTYINNEIKSWFRFDERYYEHPTDQGLSEILEAKMGRCEDMTNLAIFAMRAWGIPVMSDYTPYWANTGNNHAWNAILDENGKTIIFMGGEANPYSYKLNNVKAKVFRKSYSKQPDCIMEIKSDYTKVPPYLNSNTQIDVTNEYVEVSDIKLKLKKELPDSTEFAYICVFNSGEWKAIYWSKVDDDLNVEFKNMGMGIAYLPAYYLDGKIVPAGDQFIIQSDGTINYMIADIAKTQDINIRVTTKRSSGQTTDDIAKEGISSEISYELFYWNNGWQSIENKTAEDGILKYNNVPSNALFWLLDDDTRKEERIFTINENGQQIWW